MAQLDHSNNNRTRDLLPALVLFSKSPWTEGVKTRLSTSPNGVSAQFRQKLHRAFLRDSVESFLSLDTVALFAFWDDFERSRLLEFADRFSHFHHEQLPTSDFLSNFTFALRRASRDFTRPVILTGSDCPLITPEIFQDAATLVSEGRVAIGPAPGSGFYLIGLPPLESEPDFSSVFSAENECRSLVENFSELRPHLLPFLFDVDLPEDLLDLKAYSEALDSCGQAPKHAVHTRKTLRGLQLNFEGDDSRKRQLREA